MRKRCVLLSTCMCISACMSDAPRLCWHCSRQVLQERTPMKSVEALLVRRTVCKGWQNSCLYYLFCIVALLSTYTYCGGAVAARRNHAVSLFDPKNFQYWLLDQSR